MDNSKIIFNTECLKSAPDYLAPDCSEIRLLPEVKGGGLCHCTLPPGKISSPVAHKMVEEIWYVLEGEGEVWRKRDDQEELVAVHPGSSLTIPPATSFQFRNTGTLPLTLLIVNRNDATLAGI